MKKIVLVLLFTYLSSSYGKENLKNETLEKKEKSTKIENFFSYFNIGIGPLPIPAPRIGFGFRTQNNKCGIDVSFNASTILIISKLNISFAMLYYFDHNQSQNYLGIGGDVALIFEAPIYDGKIKKYPIFGPQFIVGKQYKNRFMEARIIWPSISTENKCLFFDLTKPFYFPRVSLIYGIGF